MAPFGFAAVAEIAPLPDHLTADAGIATSSPRVRGDRYRGEQGSFRIGQLVREIAVGKLLRDQIRAEASLEKRVLWPSEPVLPYKTQTVEFDGGEWMRLLQNINA